MAQMVGITPPDPSLVQTVVIIAQESLLALMVDTIPLASSWGQMVAITLQDHLSEWTVHIILTAIFWVLMVDIIRKEVS
ncbi:MAG: hypothetical protein Q8S51_10755 [Rhodoferax sp.]|uniref:hypothetical protein n=1 Tax=Rhodoferax sp. TaxID=50421 RepID=UPI002735E7A6|nr:hypothetical protein [Rhodoferax sp.]MDP3337252.1 hypothetical protein [Rhodoferax sp.]